MINKSEANLVSFKVLLTRDNKIMTEFSMLPEKMVDEIFPVDERALIKTVLRKGKDKLEPLHYKETKEKYNTKPVQNDRHPQQILSYKVIVSPRYTYIISTILSLSSLSG
jgi:hypothetical protein